MNIFVTDECPYISANNLDNKRMVKMLLESVQLLCTAINEHGGITPYRTTHKNHPSAIWARETRLNFEWLFRHATQLSKNYTKVYGKIHKCETILDKIYNDNLDEIVPFGPLTQFANCAAHNGKGISFKQELYAPTAYKWYLIARWNTDTKKPIWSLGMPNWVKQLDNGTFIYYDVSNETINNGTISTNT